MAGGRGEGETHLVCQESSKPVVEEGEIPEPLSVFVFTKTPQTRARDGVRVACERREGEKEAGKLLSLSLLSLLLLCLSSKQNSFNCWEGGASSSRVRAQKYLFRFVSLVLFCFSLVMME